jgi:hypothetical protein
MLKISQAVKFFSIFAILLQNASRYGKIIKINSPYKDELFRMGKLSSENVKSPPFLRKKYSVAELQQRLTSLADYRHSGLSPLIIGF